MIVSVSLCSFRCYRISHYDALESIVVRSYSHRNPCLTFVPPPLLAGDRSLADVVAHEAGASSYSVFFVLLLFMMIFSHFT